MDTLFLVKPGFQDPAYPGKDFYCWHCALIEGILASFPELARKLEVRRIDWPLPRTDVIALLGEEHQSLPLVVLEDGAQSEHESGRAHGRGFVADKDSILKVLTERHGFPHPHP
ncbi:DUF3088 domain-containing protein [Pelagibius sp. Alg239-R121]|uniref:DUF3088 domain-containing protein n=1 Tax=Pelagibius sp. Alg239-R121 TaxID=2993448 RepID=UPI0024A6D20B|nr:DUF3088 domain-containing protein [Pelagibius sp. Alg239-R121]